MDVRILDVAGDKQSRLDTWRPTHSIPTRKSNVKMAEFEGAGEAEGLQIWRIEKMVPTPVPKVRSFALSAPAMRALAFWHTETCTPEDLGVSLDRGKFICYEYSLPAFISADNG